MNAESAATEEEEEEEGREAPRTGFVCVFVLDPHLQRGQNDLLHRREVGLPEELSLLSEGQDLILVDGAHGGWDLQTTSSSRSVSTHCRSQSADKA